MIQEFNQQLRDSDSSAVALFYFSGHGFSGKDRYNNDTNYLVPLWSKNTPPKDQVSLQYKSISSDYIITSMRTYNKKGINLIVLDACRESPSEFVEGYKQNKGSNPGGFVNMDSRGVFIAYATGLGHVSFGEPKKRNSTYTGELLVVLKERDFRHKNIIEVFNETALRVAKMTEHEQLPWFSGTGVEFCFEKCSSVPRQESYISKLLRSCEGHFNANRLTTGRGGTALDCYSEVLKKERTNAEALSGLNKIEARYVAWIERALSRNEPERAKQYMASLRLVNPESLKLRDFEEQMETSIQPGKVFQDRLKDGSKGPQMVWIAAGTFKMGDIQGGGDSDEKPVHKVSITRDFAMGRYEVTFAEYDKFAKATGREKPSDRGWGRGNRPVINVSWHDATAYAKWLSKQTGKKYRLPTEAEWEYAARAGTETKYWWGNKIGSNKANCDGCGSRWDDKQTAPVGSFEANPFGIYDTVGNVWEWTQDIYSSDIYSSYSDDRIYIDPTGPSTGSLRVIRGGCWVYPASSCRAAYRLNFPPGYRYCILGFRLLRQP
ncbi:MAG: SUMF1/EgtB/PvdO family nonheme iron enzyme [Pseudomonadota bacterium]